MPLRSSSASIAITRRWALKVMMCAKTPPNVNRSAGSHKASSGSITYNAAIQRIRWTGNLLVTQPVTLTFAIQLNSVIAKVVTSAQYKTSYENVFDGDARWQGLAAQGAKVQRLLWGSTSTKNPADRDVLYIEELIGADEPRYAQIAREMLERRDFITPDDVAAQARAVLRHRVTMSPDAQIEGRDIDDLLQAALESVEAPRL